ncbi:MAG: ABC-F family ATP-binding cassette domain-containing protein [Bacteroidales bacterium]|nr:ABC-F family ATP-binding cassette domain-containing protein [Bacteroidales bacterium]
MSSILQLRDISKYIGHLALFEGVSFDLNQGDKTALIGMNGAGKSTLLNIIAGNEAPDSGEVTLLPSTKLAFLPQEPELPGTATVMESLFQTDNPLLIVIREYEEALLSGDVRRIELAGNEMERLKLWDFENRIKQILTQLKITDYHQKVRELSGGQKKRVALANSLLNEPDLLILDEPTNHLDLEVIEWLEQYLLRASISLIMVTHDRFFLDRVCNTILEIDQRRVHSYQGNYSRFTELREQRIEMEQQEVEKAKNLLRKEEEWMRRMPKARGTKAKYRIDQYYELKDISSRKRDDKKLNITIKESRSGSKILVAKNLHFAWNDVPYLTDFSYTFSRFEKIGIIGKNGSGKTTFLEILMQNLTPDAGSIEIGETMRFGYYRQAGMNFREDMRVIDAITDTAETIQMADGTTLTAAQFLNRFLFPHARQNDHIYKLSGGEKRRLYLCQVLMQNPNFLILDEPTNDLDIASLQVLEDYLATFNGCVMVVSHDRYFMDHVIDHLFVFEGTGRIKDFPGNYSQYFDSRRQEEKEQQKQEHLEKQKAQAAKGVSKSNSARLSFKEKRELEELEAAIDELESKKSELEEALNSGMLTPDELVDKSQQIGSLIQELENKSDRWLELSEKAG